jgi:hypothetical protein
MSKVLPEKNEQYGSREYWYVLAFWRTATKILKYTFATGTNDTQSQFELFFPFINPTNSRFEGKEMANHLIGLNLTPILLISFMG